MELKIKQYDQPKAIEFNFEELKTALQEKAKTYEMMVYTDDQIKEAKADRAALNKLKTALNDERIRREREYMEPFNDFKLKINQIIAIIDKPVYVIDKQVKEYEENQKKKKREEIEKIWAETEGKPEWLTLEQIFDKKWLNASVSLKICKDEIAMIVNEINVDLSTLSNLKEFGFEACEVYKTTLDVNKAINEGKRLADIQAKKKAEEEERKKQEAEAITVKAEEVVPELAEIKSDWIKFAARLTYQQALELKEFFQVRGIEFKAI